MIDLLLSRYNDMQYVLNLNWLRGMELITKAHEKILEDKVWQKWLSKYPTMNKETFIPFSEYLASHRKPTQKEKTKEQILEDARRIKAQIEGRGMDERGDF